MDNHGSVVARRNAKPRRLAPRSVRNTRARAGLIVPSCLVLCVLPQASGQDALQDICDSIDHHKAFVERSLEMVKSGTPKEQILDTLYCIRMNNLANDKIRVGANMALIHIAEDHPTIQKYLVRMIRAAEGTEQCDGIACTYLMYVADEEGRRVLREQLKRSWPGLTCGDAVSALRELGDESLIGWLEQAISEFETDQPGKAISEEQIRFVRAQRSLEDLLQYLRSQRTGVSDFEVIRQAIRHGATREDIRQSYLQRLQDYEGDQSKRRLYRQLVRNALSRGAFDDSDVAALHQDLRMPAEKREEDCSDYSVWPSWATLPRELDRRFWVSYRFEEKE
jgi:hypothetical protein